MPSKRKKKKRRPAPVKPAPKDTWYDLPPDEIEQARARSAERHKKAFGVKNVVIKDTPPDRKLSERVLEMIWTRFDPDGGRDHATNLIVSAIHGWNASLFPKSQRAAMIEDAATSLPPAAHRQFKRDVEHFIRIKHDLYPADVRVINDWEIAFTDEGLHFTASTHENAPG